MPKYPYRQIGVSLNRQFRNDQNANLEDIAADIAEQKSRVDTQIANVPQPSEVVDARVDTSGTEHATLKDRLDSGDQNTASQLAEKATQSSRFYALSFDNVSMKLVIMKSDDGINFNSLNVNGSFTPPPSIDGKQKLRDPSCIKKGMTYIIFYTGIGSTGNYFRIVTTNDFINFTAQPDIVIPISGMDIVWAPAPFMDDDGTIYVVVNASINSGNKQVYVAELNDDYTCGSFTQITGLQANMIDAHIYKIDRKYYMIFKNEDTKYIEVAVSYSLLTGWSLLKTGDWAGWGSGLEGPWMMRLDDRWRMYVDDYDRSIDGVHNIFYSDSFDGMSSWSKLSNINADFDCRHLMIVDRNAPITGHSRIFDRIIRLSDVAVNHQIASFSPQRDTTYVLYGGDGEIDISNIDASNLHNGDIFFMIAESLLNSDFIKLVRSGLPSSPIIFNANNSNNFYIGNLYGNSNLIIEFKCLMVGNVKKIYLITKSDVAYSKIQLTPSYTSITAVKNAIYYCMGTDVVTISTIDTSSLVFGDEIYFCLQSQSPSASITLNTSACMLPKDQNYTISLANGNNEGIIVLIMTPIGLRMKI